MDNPHGSLDTRLRGRRPTAGFRGGTHPATAALDDTLEDINTSYSEEMGAAGAAASGAVAAARGSRAMKKGHRHTGEKVLEAAGDKGWKAGVPGKPRTPSIMSVDSAVSMHSVAMSTRSVATVSGERRAKRASITRSTTLEPNFQDQNPSDSQEEEALCDMDERGPVTSRYSSSKHISCPEEYVVRDTACDEGVACEVLTTDEDLLSNSKLGSVQEMEVSLGKVPTGKHETMITLSDGNPTRGVRNTSALHADSDIYQHSSTDTKLTGHPQVEAHVETGIDNRDQSRNANGGKEQQNFAVNNVEIECIFPSVVVNDQSTVKGLHVTPGMDFDGSRRAEPVSVNLKELSPTLNWATGTILASEHGHNPDDQDRVEKTIGAATSKKFEDRSIPTNRITKQTNSRSKKQYVGHNNNNTNKNSGGVVTGSEPSSNVDIRGSEVDENSHSHYKDEVTGGGQSRETELDDATSSGKLDEDALYENGIKENITDMNVDEESDLSRSVKINTVDEVGNSYVHDPEMTNVKSETLTAPKNSSLFEIKKDFVFSNGSIDNLEQSTFIPISLDKNLDKNSEHSTLGAQEQPDKCKYSNNEEPKIDILRSHSYEDEDEEITLHSEENVDNKANDLVYEINVDTDPSFYSTINPPQEHNVPYIYPGNGNNPQRKPDGSVIPGIEDEPVDEQFFNPPFRNGWTTNRRRPNSSNGLWQELPDENSSFRSDDGSSIAMQDMNVTQGEDPDGGNNGRRSGSSFRRYGTRSRQHGLSFSLKRWRRATILACVGMLVIVIATTLTGVLVHQRLSNKNSIWKGALGSVPKKPDTVALPVLNLVNTGNDTMDRDSMYFGFSLNWMTDDPQGLNEQFDIKSSIFSVKFNIGSELEMSAIVNSSGNIVEVEDYFGYTAGLIGTTNAIMYISLIPDSTMAGISETALESVVTNCERFNKWGISILLSLAPEMNGWWYPWGQQPRDYVSTFQSLSTLIHANNATKNMTAMVWSPHVSPYDVAIVGQTLSQQAAVANISQHTLAKLDTNNDGNLTVLDDPFGAYYPGHEYVDWVGLTGMVSTMGSNNRTVDTEYDMLLPGHNFTDSTTDEVIQSKSRNVYINSEDTVECDTFMCEMMKTHSFYDRFAVNGTNPVVISDLSVPQADLHADFLESVVTSVRDFPFFKAVTWYQNPARLKESDTEALSKATRDDSTGQRELNEYLRSVYGIDEGDNGAVVDTPPEKLIGTSSSTDSNDEGAVVDYLPSMIDDIKTTTMYSSKTGASYLNPNFYTWKFYMNDLKTFNMTGDIPTPRRSSLKMNDSYLDATKELARNTALEARHSKSKKDFESGSDEDESLSNKFVEEEEQTGHSIPSNVGNVVRTILVASRTTATSTATSTAVSISGTSSSDGQEANMGVVVGDKLVKFVDIFARANPRWAGSYMVVKNVQNRTYTESSTDYSETSTAINSL